MNKEVDFEEKHQADLRRLHDMRLLDDDFMTKVFEDKRCAEFLLQIVLKRYDLKVMKSTSQYGIKNLQGRSVRLDILAIDQQNHVYDIEIQRNDHGAGVKRARYNSSLIDANITEPGEQYERLNESYVIFITENDVLQKGLPIYHIDRIIAETGEPFGDEEHIIYVNSQIKDETSLGMLMHDFACTEAKDMYYQVLADRVRYFKEDEKGVAIMSKVMDELRNETAREIARNMLALNKLSYDDIAKVTGLTVKEIEELDTKRSA